MKRTLITLASLIALCLNVAAIDIIHGPYLQNLGSDEVTIVWVSDSVSLGWVELAPNDGSHFYGEKRPQFYDSKSGIRTESRIHKVRLKGLEPGTTYRYRVFAREVREHKGNYVQYGKTTATRVYRKEPLTFKTLDKNAQTVNFFMLTDIHGRSEVLENLVGKVDLAKEDMALFVGDMVSVFESEEQVFGGFMDKAVELFASEIPMYYTRGNHETRGVSASRFQDYFSPFSEHIYYMYRQGPVCFIALDSGEDKPDNDIEYYGLTEYERYRDEQAEWLKEIVQTEEFKSAPFKIVTCHIPPTGGRRWFGNAEVSRKFVPILEEAGIDVMLCGHLHEYGNNPGGSLARFPIIVNSNNTVLKAEVSGSELKIEVVDTDGRLVDSFSIKK